MTIKLQSSAFADGRPIPKIHTEDGSDISPPLAWENVPAGTRELALVCDDPDAPTTEPWVHWVIYKIPGDLRVLKESIPPQPQLQKDPAGAMQGRNSWTSGRTTGYRGPAPPPGHGTHHYHFRIYALDAALPLEPRSDKPALLRAIHGHVLGQGLLIGTYGR
ncbi:MAG: YbhB/YbcL family Raf kinase inhibitor-like protein [Planctomycetia bacterium]|nr:YbhB/YbcL family Raf kinase inhibitor-like protein [Planctomycetia bacterium]